MQQMLYQYSAFLVLLMVLCFVASVNINKMFIVNGIFHFQDDVGIGILFLGSMVMAVIVLNLCYRNIFLKEFRLLEKQIVSIKEHDLSVESGVSKIKEVEELLLTLDSLKVALSDSLEKQWLLEEQKREAILALSHDMKTPIAIIKGNCELVGEMNLLDEQRLYNEVSLRNIDRMETYLEKMRIIYDSYSLLENVEMRQQNFDVFIDSLRLDFETLAKSQQKELLFETKECGNYLFSETLFRTALSNIVMNGLEHGGTQIFVRVYRNQDIHIIVEDSGEGFLDEVVVNGPVEFTTANKARTMEPQNLHLGLGLYQAKVIIEKHGGKLSLSKSEKLGGAKVEIIL